MNENFSTIIDRYASDLHNHDITDHDAKEKIEEYLSGASDDDMDAIGISYHEYSEASSASSGYHGWYERNDLCFAFRDNGGAICGLER